MAGPELGNVVNAGLFNLAATQLGKDYDRYEWRDAGELGAMEAGEVTLKNKPIDYADPQHAARIRKIYQKARTLMDSYLSLDPSPAIRRARVYQKSGPAVAAYQDAQVPSTDRLYELFKRYLQFVSLSCQEGAMATAFTADLTARGVTVRQDHAAEKIFHDPELKGDCDNKMPETNNVIGFLKGDPKLPSLHFSIHLDGTPPQIGPIPHQRIGDIVASTGQSILRGDDAAGAVIVLALLDYVKASRLPHGDIHISGLIAEEVGADGARVLDDSDMQGDFAFVFDALTTDYGVIYGGSDLYGLKLRVEGHGEHFSKAADGEAVNAEHVASMITVGAWGLDEKSRYHGRPSTIVGFARTSGTKESEVVDGKPQEKILPRNNVANVAVLNGQVRSWEANTRKTILAQMESEMQAVCAKAGATCSLTHELWLPGFVDKSTPMIRLAQLGYRFLGREPQLRVSHGGSNMNFLHPKRGNIVLMPIGSSLIHTTDETLDLKDTRESVKLAIGMLRELAQYRSTLDAPSVAVPDAE